MRRRNVVRAIWVQLCAAMPPENETFIYLLSCLKIKKKGRQKYMYVHNLWCKCITSRDANDLVRSQKFLFDLFLSPVNWTVQNLRKKHKLLSGSMEPDTVWFDSVWRYFLPAAGQKPSRLLFTSMAPRARQCFFSPSAAFSGDQCYYWVGSNYCTGFFFYLPWTEFQQKIDNACAAVMAKLDSRIITPAREPAGREESAPPL